MIVADTRILVFSEDQSTDTDLHRMLQSSGYQASNVVTEVDCLSSISRSIPDLLIIDLPLPLIDVHALVTESLKLREELPIILLSRFDADTNISAASATNNEGMELVSLLEAGATDFLRFTAGDESLLQYVIQKNVQQMPRRANQRMVESLKTLERDQQAGFRVQQGMMPATPAVFGNITFDHKIYPSLILSGDFIDYFELPDGRVLFYLADVSGHGASSAFVTVLLKSLSRRLEKDFQRLNLNDTGEILRWLNRELLQCDLEQHITMFLGIVDQQSNSLEYSNAAQFPAAILSTGNRSQFLEIGGLPLGLYKTPEYDSRAVSLTPRFSIVMFSDGVFEIMPEQTLKAKEEHLLSLVESGNIKVDALAEQLGIVDTEVGPDDIAVFTIAGVG